jgi:hypothetical protein
MSNKMAAVTVLSGFRVLWWGWTIVPSHRESLAAGGVTVSDPPRYGTGDAIVASRVRV